MKLSPVRGTRDFFPEDMRLRSWLFDHWRRTAMEFGFEEYDAPVVEPLELYVRKAGEEISGQLYTLTSKSGVELALRPEMTPSLARLILAKGGSLSLPAKWFSIPQCWRYERMSRGRKREHYQWNVDIFGIPGVQAEAELLAVITGFLSRIGLTAADVGIKVSSRKALQSVLETLGVTAQNFAPVCVLVDKLDKLPREAIEADLAALGLGPGVVDSLIDTLSLKSIDALAEVLGEDHEAVTELRSLWSLADAYGCADWLVFDASIVRGLAYYTGTVFEAFDRGATLRAICGGGRYDRLLSTFGGKDLPACGFGFGDVVVLELLKDKDLLPNLPGGVDAVVFPMETSTRREAMQVAATLRAEGKAVDLVLDKKKMKWVFKHAERRGATELVVIGPDDVAAGEYSVKNLETGEKTRRPMKG
jgi:histidyl-tRNA synthetase